MQVHHAAPRNRTLLKVVVPLFGLLVVTWFGMIGSGNMVLFDPDEARCALITRDMMTNAHWLQPHLLGTPYFDKPPLFFWMLGASVKTFGENEWALRLVPALVAAATVVLTGILAWQFANRAAGLLAACTFALSAAVVIGSRVIRMDMLLAFWITAALICWSRTYMLGGSRRWYILMYICMGFGCLTKGPVAILLPALIIFIYVTLNSRVSRESESLVPDPRSPIPSHQSPARSSLRAKWRDLLSMRMGLGLLIILVIYGSWVAYMTWQFPHYPREFFFRQNLDRYAGSGLGRTEPWWYMPGALAAMLLPWSLLIAAASWALRPRRGLPAHEKFLWIWGLVVLFFFLPSKSQLPNYLLPMLPSTFALLGIFLARAVEFPRAAKTGLIGTLILAGVTALMWPVLYHTQLHFEPVPLKQVPKEITRGDVLSLLVSLAILVAIAVVARQLYRRRSQWLMAPMLVGFAGFIAAFACGSGRTYFASRSSIDLARDLRGIPPTKVPLYMMTEPRFGMAFYAPPGWQFEVVKTQDLPKLRPLLERSRPFYAVLTGQGLYDTLMGTGPYRVELDGRELTLRDRMTVIACEGSDRLVRIDPAPQAVTATQPATARNLSER